MNCKGPYLLYQDWRALKCTEFTWLMLPPAELLDSKIMDIHMCKICKEKVWKGLQEMFDRGFKHLLYTPCCDPIEKRRDHLLSCLHQCFYTYVCFILISLTWKCLNGTHICKVHQAGFVHNKTHLRTSALAHRYLLVMEGRVFSHSDISVEPLTIFNVFFLTHFNFFTSQGPQSPDMHKYLSMSNLKPLKFLGKKAAELGPQKSNLDTGGAGKRFRSRNTPLQEGNITRFWRSQCFTCDEEHCVWRGLRGNAWF